MSYAEVLRSAGTARLQPGAEAVEALVLAHQAEVFRLAVSVLGDPAEAEEATQDALIAALTALETYRGEASLTTWLYTITVNACRARFRKRRSRERLVRASRRLLHNESKSISDGSSIP